MARFVTLDELLAGRLLLFFLIDVLEVVARFVGVPAFANRALDRVAAAIVVATAVLDVVDGCGVVVIVCFAAPFAAV